MDYINNINQLLIGVVVLGLLLTMSFLIISSGKEMIVSSIDTTEYINSTIAINVDTFQQVNSNCVPDENLVILEVYNGTQS